MTGNVTQKEVATVFFHLLVSLAQGQPIECPADMEAFMEKPTQKRADSIQFNYLSSTPVYILRDGSTFIYQPDDERWQGEASR